MPKTTKKSPKSVQKKRAARRPVYEKVNRVTPPMHVVSKTDVIFPTEHRKPDAKKYVAAVVVVILIVMGGLVWSGHIKINRPGGGTTPPTEPTEPTGPAEPTDPTGPTEPADPTGPTDPTGPAEPTKPTEPKKMDKKLVIGLSVGASVLVIVGLAWHYRKKLRQAQAGVVDFSMLEDPFGEEGRNMEKEAQGLFEEGKKISGVRRKKEANLSERLRKEERQLRGDLKRAKREAKKAATKAGKAEQDVKNFMASGKRGTAPLEFLDSEIDRLESIGQQARGAAIAKEQEARNIQMKIEKVAGDRARANEIKKAAKNTLRVLPD